MAGAEARQAPPLLPFCRAEKERTQKPPAKTAGKPPCNSCFDVIYYITITKDTDGALGYKRENPAAEWGERPREKVTVMPGRRGKRGAAG